MSFVDLFRSNMGLFWLNMGLFWSNMGLVWSNIGLFWSNVGLIWSIIGLFRFNIFLLLSQCRLLSSHTGLLWSNMGLFSSNLRLFWSNMGLFWSFYHLRAVGNRLRYLQSIVCRVLAYKHSMQGVSIWTHPLRQCMHTACRLSVSCIQIDFQNHSNQNIAVLNRLCHLSVCRV